MCVYIYIYIYIVWLSTTIIVLSIFSYYCASQNEFQELFLMNVHVLIDTQSHPYIRCLCKKKNSLRKVPQNWHTTGIKHVFPHISPLWIQWGCYASQLHTMFSTFWNMFMPCWKFIGACLNTISPLSTISVQVFPPLLYGIILDKNLLALWRRCSSSNLFLTKWIPAELSQLWCLYHAGEKGTHICSAQSNPCFCSDKM